MSYIKDMALMGMRNTTASPSGSAVNADWAENNPNSASYVKNRTHYAERIVTFDGVLEGKEYVQIEEGTYLVKVSDTPLVEEDLDRLVLTMELAGETVGAQIPREDIQVMENGVIIGPDYLFASTPSECEYEGLTFTRGLYLLSYDQYVWVKALAIGVEKLDEVFMPNSYSAMQQEISNMDYNYSHSIGDLYNKITSLSYADVKIIPFTLYDDGNCQTSEDVIKENIINFLTGEKIITKAVIDDKIVLDYTAYEDGYAYFTAIYNGEYYELKAYNYGTSATLTKHKLAFATE